MTGLTRLDSECSQDTVICAGGVSFNVRRIVMCNCSPYFQALFCRHAGDRTHFTIPGVSAEMMKIIINFAYSGSVSVTKNNVQDLLIAADYLIVTNIVEACNNFLEENLTPKNCIGVCRLIISSPQAQHKAHFLLMNRFEEVVSSQEFLELSLQELTDILDSDELNVDEEKTVYEAAVRWINHEPEQRTSHLPALLSKARLALNHTDDIKTLMSDPYLTNNTQCLQILEDVLRLKHQLSNATPPRRFCSDLAARPRLPNAIIFAIGGWNPSETNITEVYDDRADCWLDITDHQEKPCRYHGTVYHDGLIYCIGGFDAVEFLNSMHKFDVKRRVWLEAAPMKHRRCYVSVAVLDGYIYAIGGIDRAHYLRTAERYRPETDQWSLISPMNDVRSRVGCAAFNEKIYVCGGHDGHRYLRSCEFYSPAFDQWTRFSDMSTRRGELGVILYDNRIFALGGFDGKTRLKSVEAYDPQTNKWRKTPPMLTPRGNCGTAVTNNKLFVMGGHNNFNINESVECYDAKTKAWTRAGQMRANRWGLSCCVVSDHPSVKQYTTSRDAFPHLEEV
ncbi:kelch-like protein 10 [Antennarius striatus]|uniref:kelch-like protein 10 n=1 Tax=Antennarius striatus TaxID=241820 RepID=UPI0035B01265